MSDHQNGFSQEPSPQPQPIDVRRLIRWFVLFDVFVVLGILGVWLMIRSDDSASRANVVNDGLRGSLPPAAQTLPSLSGIDGIKPAIVPAGQGGATMLIATCFACQSGDVIGGYLGRLAAEDLPESAHVLVVGWDGDPDAWRSRHQIAERIAVHAATTPRDAAAVKAQLRVGESGIAFLAGPDGAWRSTFHLGQLDRADIRHDLEQLAGE